MSFNNCREGERGGATEREELYLARIDALAAALADARATIAAFPRSLKGVDFGASVQWDGSDIGEGKGEN